MHEFFSFFILSYITLQLLFLLSPLLPVSLSYLLFLTNLPSLHLPSEMSTPFRDIIQTWRGPIRPETHYQIKAG